MLVTLENLAEVVNATYGFDPEVYDNCVCFQLLTDTKAVDVILSIEQAEGISEDRPVLQAVRIAFYFVDEAGPLDFTARGLLPTLEFIHRMEYLAPWGSLRVYEGEKTLEVFLYAIVSVTLPEIKKFCAEEASCPLVDAFLFLCEEWDELQGPLAAFCQGGLQSPAEMKLLLQHPQGYA